MLLLWRVIFKAKKNSEIIGVLAKECLPDLVQQMGYEVLNMLVIYIRKKF